MGHLDSRNQKTFSAGLVKFIINIPVYQSHLYDGLIDLLKAGPRGMYYMYN